MRTTTRGSRLLALPVLCLLLPLTACGDGDHEDGRDGRSDAAPATMADLRWDIDDAIATADACDTWVVRADIGEQLQVVDVANDRVLLPKVTPPPGSDLEPDDRWLTDGGCVPTPDGPVVVVETQDLFTDIADAPPKLVAGLTPEGEQLWVREEPGQVLGDYDGTGSFLLERLGPEAGHWAVVDARTGATVAEGEGDRTDPDARRPSLALARDLVSTLEATVVRLPGWSPYLEGIAAGVDADRVLLAGAGGLSLVRLADAATLWQRGDVSYAAVSAQAADLTTGIVLATDREGHPVGLDLATGATRWTSELERGEVNLADPQVGSGVVVVRDGADIDRQVVLDAATGERLPEPDGTLVVGQELLLLVDDEGRPSSITVDDLR